MFEVTSSPSILESFNFGFTEGKKSSELENLIKNIKVDKVKHSNYPIDMAFGYVVMSLPNPCEDFNLYKECRESFIAELTKVVQPYKEG